MTAKIIYGKEVANKIKEEVKSKVLMLEKKPALTVILVGENAASKVYVNNKHKMCKKLGIKSDIVVLPEDTTQAFLLDLIKKLNNDKNISGILVQLPLPKHIAEEAVINTVHPLKDVDCFHPENIGLMFAGQPRFLPCTPAGVMEILKFTGVNLSGMNAVIIGRSNIVGKPQAILLLEKHATVTIVHSRTKNIASIVKNADLLVSAVGIKHFVRAEMVKEGVIVIDVGINRIKEKLYGDVDFDEVVKKASYLTPVPGGVGVMTIAVLMQNTLKAYELQQTHNI
ncbi:MAG: bifunctional 5,10-methylenetetrahydrofolate dehydrogenase/5,10-methenyltetrahydrofolate cyclohydrolase [bacterium]|nr:bifunctional 5,10-methylenetetrahydrofolate dehydrogenase/5,10-methenyltetrahydrofolate cyclohydrolase [bacterium]